MAKKKKISFIKFQDLRLGASEIDKLRKMDLKHLLKDKKLILILDLDHTLINSTRMFDVFPEEQYLIKQVEEAKGKSKKLLVFSINLLVFYFCSKLFN